MSIDRTATLRNAEKLLRQGKVDAAIAEYVRVVDDHPRDWNTGNTLGDLYLRAGNTGRAVEQFIRIADSLNEQGFLSKAAALYKKVLKLEADHEHALLQAGDIAAQQGFYADARAHLGAVIERRKAGGDARGAAEVRIRLGLVDPTDFDGRIAAANTRLEIEDVSGAAREFVQIAADLAGTERYADALSLLDRAAAVTQNDQTIRREVHDRLLAIAAIQLQSGRVDEGLTVAKRLLDEDASRRAQVAAIGWNIAAVAPDAAFLVIELTAGVSVAQREWAAAAAALQEFVARVPNHVPALMRLVEVSVDGGLDAALSRAQAQLADAYLAAGLAVEARYIAEDLVAREPSDPANVERLRRTLELLGEADPDAIIAERLSAQSSSTLTDLNAEDAASSESVGLTINTPSAAPSSAPAATGFQPPAPIEPSREPAERDPLYARAPDGVERTTDTPSRPPTRSTTRRDVDVFKLSGNAVDIESILRELDPPRPEASAHASDSFEVDLSIVLDDMKRPSPGTARDRLEPPPTIQGTDIEDVFAQLRAEASRRSAIDAAEQEFRRALALKAAGDVDGCIAALQSASKAPKLRFATASLLGRLFRERGLTSEAADWYERASQAPAPTADDYHGLLFELAEVLEAEGEIVRALAVCLELQADAGDYRDVATRVDRLAKVQARG